MNPLVCAQQLVFGYDASNGLFPPLDIACDSGEVLAILGTNGRGKTTLLHTLLGILPPLAGEIRRQGRIGFVPQFFTSPFSYCVLDIVLMGRASLIGLFSMPGRRDRQIAQDILISLGCGDLKDRPFAELSGGQRQLVLIARALAMECKTLILDEPTAALDLHNQARVLRLIERLAKEQQLSVIFTSHDPAHVLITADRALLLMDERQVIQGRCQEVLTEGNLQHLYGLPVKHVDVIDGGQHYRSLLPLYQALKEE